MRRRRPASQPEDQVRSPFERLLDAVDWPKISKGKADVWLYFYEDFLAIYDNSLRKETGSYYTPPEVVGAMVALVDQGLKRPGFGLPRGLADDSVPVADPATGTGTFVLGVLRHLAACVRDDEGEGAVPVSIESALKRLVAFELQLGPFAVAQLRLLAEVLALTGSLSKVAPRMYVTDTLSNPFDDGGSFPGFPGFTAAIGQQRRAANRVKREQPITVVIDCSPEGHQPEVSSRIFQGVQQPVCIVLAARYMGGDKAEPARVRWRALPEGHSQAKFDALKALTLNDAGCRTARATGERRSCRCLAGPGLRFPAWRACLSTTGRA